jgi:hypothetical protein
VTSIPSSRFLVGPALSQSFEIMFRNIVPFGIIALLLTAPLFFLDLVSYDPTFEMQQTTMDSGSPDDPEAANLYTASVTSGFVYSGTGIFLYFIVWALATAAMSYGTYESLRGRPASLGQCLKKGLPLIIPAIVVTILWALATFAGFLLLIIPGIILGTIWYVIIPVTVVERPGIFAAFGRSAELTRGNRWRVFGISLVVGVIVWVINMLAGLTSLVTAGNASAVLLVGWIVAAVNLVIGSVVVAVVYYYLRIAREGGSIEDIAAVFD